MKPTTKPTNGHTNREIYVGTNISDTVIRRSTDTDTDTDSDTAANSKLCHRFYINMSRLKAQGSRLKHRSVPLGTGELLRFSGRPKIVYFSPATLPANSEAPFGAISLVPCVLFMLGGRSNLALFSGCWDSRLGLVFHV